MTGCGQDPDQHIGRDPLVFPFAIAITVQDAMVLNCCRVLHTTGLLPWVM